MKVSVENVGITPGVTARLAVDRGHEHLMRNDMENGFSHSKDRYVYIAHKATEAVIQGLAQVPAWAVKSAKIAGLVALGAGIVAAGWPQIAASFWAASAVWKACIFAVGVGCASVAIEHPRMTAWTVVGGCAGALLAAAFAPAAGVAGVSGGTVLGGVVGNVLGQASKNGSFCLVAAAVVATILVLDNQRAKRSSSPCQSPSTPCQTNL